MLRGIICYMNDDVIADLKQFIVATVSQHTADLATKEDVHQIVNKESRLLRNEMNDRFDEVQNAVGF